MRTAMCITILTLITAGFAHAGQWEVDVTDLVGAYSDDEQTSRTHKIVYRGLTRQTRRVSLLVGGDVAPGELYCRSEYRHWWMDARVEVQNQRTEFKYLSSWRLSTATFEHDVTMGKFDGSGMILRPGDELVVELRILPTGYWLICAPGRRRPSVSLTFATLVFDLRAATGTEVNTWGRIKALYE